MKIFFLYHQKTHHYFIIDILAILLSIYLPIPIYVSLFLYCLAIQDGYTLYISKRWIIPSLLLLTFFDSYSLFTGLFLGSVSYVMYRKKWMGSADVLYMAYFGFLVGFERMMVALLIAVITGLVIYIKKQDKMIPFLSCLSFGILISLCKGYTIFYYLLNLSSKGISIFTS
ncbi:A24 family peptidase [Floccifex sp.]|uniref:A24 family peptidase n=1 Tax=Floccifex sp. TaxID=2815810 RepID=UPI002A7626A4|nr:A24 family peptidase [Floccifex sp.]MDD7281079.1 A24 family peptidase [Erysipelotrichaceae bacterium]MDY2958351.1 A24 family peptidase [Floccifex sp.]